MKILSTAALLALAATTPALADDTFYIVRDPTAQHCVVVREKPANESIVIGGRVYTSRSEARSALTTVCTNNGNEEDDDD